MAGTLEGAVKVAKGTRLVWMVPHEGPLGCNYSQLVESWIADLRSGRGMTRRNPASEATIQFYEYGLKALWALSGKVSSLDNLTVETLEAALLAVPFSRGDEKDGYSKKNMIFNAFLSLSKHLERQGLRSADDIAATKRLKVSRKFPAKRPVVREGEFTQLVAYNETWPSGREFEAYALKVVLHLMGRAGLRRAEIAGLKLADVDLARAELSVVGKGDKRREVGMPADLVAVVTHWIKAYRPKTKAPHLIVSREGEPLTVAAIRSKIKRLSEASEIDCTPHAFRRYCASFHAQNGTPLPFIQANLGHSDIKTTMGYIQVDRQAALDAFKQGGDSGDNSDNSAKSPRKKPRIW